jgi:hypothetical protein
MSSTSKLSAARSRHRYAVADSDGSDWGQRQTSLRPVVARLGVLSFMGFDQAGWKVFRLLTSFAGVKLFLLATLTIDPSLCFTVRR